MKISSILLLFTYSFSIFTALYLVEINKSIEPIFYAITLFGLLVFSLYLISNTKKALVLDIFKNNKVIIIYCASLLLLQFVFHGFNIAGIRLVITLFSALLAYVFIGGLLHYHQPIFIKFMKIILFSTVLLSFFSILSNFGISKFIFLPMSEKYGAYGISGLHATGGIIEHPNKMGGQILIALGALILFRKNLIMQKFLLLILLLGLFLSFGRGGWLGAFIGFLAILSITKSRNKNFIKLKPILVSIAVISIMFISWSFLKNSQTVNSLLRVDRGTSGRDIMWVYAVSKAVEKPLTGYGFRSDTYLKEISTGEFGNIAAQSGWHNVFISHLTQFGILGLLLYLSIFLIPMYRLYKSSVPIVYKKSLLFIIVAMFVAANFTAYNIGGLRSMPLAMSIVLGVANMSNLYEKRIQWIS